MVTLKYPDGPKLNTRIYFDVQGQTLSNLCMADDLDSTREYPAGCKLDSEESWAKFFVRPHDGTQKYKVYSPARTRFERKYIMREYFPLGALSGASEERGDTVKCICACMGAWCFAFRREGRAEGGATVSTEQPTGCRGSTLPISTL